MNSNPIHKITIFVFTLTLSSFIQCGTDSQNNSANQFKCGDTLTDIDGNNYRTILIGDQCWMADNLRSSTYRDGTTIPNYPVEADWRTTNNGAWVNYSNNSGYDQVYGKIYNWFAVTDSRGICPEGWIVPGDEDWKTLEITIGMTQSDADSTGWRGTDQNIGGKLRIPGLDFWESPNEGASNDSGFSGMPSGLRYPDGRFLSLGRSAFFWTSTWFSISEAYGRVIVFSRGGVSRGVYRKDFGLSVRCILETDEGE
jgi:uncharacterized protein (TIGR02145 family)